MLRVYYGEISKAPEDPAGLPLSSYRLACLSSLRPKEKRRQSIGAELLLIQALREMDPSLELPLVIETDENGKPFLKDSNLFFSLSHSGSFAACAVADRAVGLDIQVQQIADSAIMRRCFTQKEREYVSAAEDENAAFTELWTRKESYAKALGLGLRLPFGSFSAFAPPGGASVWSVKIEVFYLSVCTLKGAAEPDGIEKRELF